MSSVDYLRFIFSTGDFNETFLHNHLGKFGIKSDLATRQIVTLSSGQRVRLWLAKEVLQNGNPSLPLLDEVTENLDKERVDSLVLSLSQFPGAVLSISHDEYFCQKFYSAPLTQQWKLQQGMLFTIFL